MHSHSNTIWRECSSTCIVVEPTEIVISSYILQAGVIFKGMDSALVFHCLRTANIVVVGKKELFRAVKLPTPARRFLGSVVPAHFECDLLRRVQLNMFNSGHVWRSGGIWWPQSHRITSCIKPKDDTVSTVSRDQGYMFV